MVILNYSIIFFQLLAIVIAIITAIILWKTIENDKELNQGILFNEVVNQERELRIKLDEYRENICQKLGKKSEDSKQVILSYDTLLFNYYEYLAISVYQGLIDEEVTKLYFTELLQYVRQMFEDAILFKEGYADKSQYKALQWLFKRWKITY